MICRYIVSYSMASTINFLRLIADPTRLRLLLLLEQEELSVAELQEILGMGQSRISSHLGQLKRAEFASELAKKHGFRNIEYRVGDMQEPPIANNSVDLAIFSQALHHAPKPERAIRSAYSIL